MLLSHSDNSIFANNVSVSKGGTANDEDIEIVLDTSTEYRNSTSESSEIVFFVASN